MPFHKDKVGDDLHIARSATGTSNPSSVVTPGIIGEFFYDTTANVLYVAEGLTDTDWVVVPTGASAVGFTISFDANDAIFPDSNPAVAASRNNHPILGFDDTTAESIVFNETIPNSYSAESINVDIDWVAEAATTGGVTWGVEVEANASGGNDIDSDSFDTQQTGNSDTNATSGVITRTTITLTQAEADNVAANDSFRLRIQRVVSDGDDDMTDDAQIVKVSVRV